MSARRWFRGLRLLLGFLLAPALVPLALRASLDLVTAHFGVNLSEFDRIWLRTFVQTFGVGMAYLAVLCLGLPYILLLLKMQRLNFRTIMVPAVVLSWVYSVGIYAALHREYSHAAAVAALCVPGVVLAGLGFYFLGVWRSPEEEPAADLLLQDYLPAAHS